MDAAVRTVALSGPAVWDAPGMDDVTDPWERHAGWWQEGFTDGADAEYTEQILPLSASIILTSTWGCTVPTVLTLLSSGESTRV